MGQEGRDRGLRVRVLERNRVVGCLDEMIKRRWCYRGGEKGESERVPYQGRGSKGVRGIELWQDLAILKSVGVLE